MATDNPVAVRALASAEDGIAPAGHVPGLLFPQRVAFCLETPAGHSMLLGLVMLDFILVVLEISISLFYECGHGSKNAEMLRHVLSWVTVAILCCFLVELLLKLVAFGLPYFKKLIHVFDALVVVCSLALTLALHGPESELAGLLVILRLWRVLRLVDSMVVINQVHNEDRHRRQWEAREQQLVLLQARIVELEALLGSANGQA